MSQYDRITNELYSGCTAWQDADVPSSGEPQYGYRVGTRANGHILYGQLDMQTEPTTFNRIGTRWGDVQLKNGWSGTNWGRRLRYKTLGYLDGQFPTIPGQSRLSGQRFADFPAQGPAPSQWAQHYAQTAGQQPMYPGGPGQIQGALQINNFGPVGG